MRFLDESPANSGDIGRLTGMFSCIGARSTSIGHLHYNHFLGIIKEAQPA
jgi:hypothetical protein